MTNQREPQKVHQFIISGGGTGGHIFPALAIADALRQADPSCKITFVGAEGRMEMEKVPAAGYPIIGLPVQGLYRSLTPKNLRVIWRLLKSIRMSRKILKEYAPTAVIGVGGYASAPVLWQASRMHIPCIIQEQNSYAGKTNKWLSKRVNKICVAYPHMERFFPKEKLVFTGNPIRSAFETELPSKEEGRAFFELDRQKPTLLVVGGSLGAHTINRSIGQHLDLLGEQVQLLWQTGKYDYDQAVQQAQAYPQVKILKFIQQMDMAYAAADLVISRAGACSISELCVLRKACILVPSPNVTEDHQTKNALALSERDGAILIPDREAENKLLATAIETVRQPELCLSLSKNIHTLARHQAAKTIAEVILQLIS